MCSQPISIINPHWKKVANIYRVNVRHFDQEKDYRLLVPCGHCLDCLRKRARSWMVRAHYLVKSRNIKIDRISGHTYFCTLSIAPKNYEFAVKNPYKVFRRFVDRLRKHPSLIVGYNKRNRPIYKKVRFDYLAVIEFADGLRAEQRGLPSTYRMHYHAIFFDCPLKMKDLKKMWDKHVGISWISRLRSEAGIFYCLKYVFKDQEKCQKLYGDESKTNGKMIVSHGFGRFRSEDMKKYRDNLIYSSKTWVSTMVNNFRYPVPRYWKKLLFSSKEIKSLNEKFIPPLIRELVESKYATKSKKYRETLIDFMLYGIDVFNEKTQ